ncbi:uncharacterized protein RJT21DRAFT_3243 [Scheffersomyces amazonensis]|uniref:uncharacterized protein n=1 Tax=Scheffersomyces amazonensis TaxID=1078765 RepID=UPI00315DB2D1
MYPKYLIAIAVACVSISSGYYVEDQSIFHIEDDNINNEDICFNGTDMTGYKFKSNNLCMSRYFLSNTQIKEFEILAKYKATGNITEDLKAWLYVLFGYSYPTDIDQYIDWIEYLDEISVNSSKLKSQLNTELIEKFDTEQVQQVISHRRELECNQILESAYNEVGSFGYTNNKNNRNMCGYNSCCLSWSKASIWSFGGLGYASVHGENSCSGYSFTCKHFGLKSKIINNN